MTTEKNNRYIYRYYLVAYLDISGQKEELNKIESLPKNQEEKQNFEQAIRKTFGVIKKFRETFCDRFDVYKSDQDRPIPQGLSHNEKIGYKKIQETAKKFIPRVKSFSDAIIIYAPLSDNDKNIYVGSIYITLLSIAECFITLMAGGNIFRGGIDIGYAAEIDDGGIYGPVLTKVYILESKVAEYPRIVLGKKLVEFLRRNIENNEIDTLSKLNKEYAKRCLRMLMEDGDGRYAIDYLGEECRDTIGGVSELLPRAQSFLRKQVDEIKKEKNTKLFLRYHTLVDYFDYRLPLWEIKN